MNALGVRVLPIFVQDVQGGATIALDMDPGARVYDLVKEVERQTGVVKAVSYEGEHLIEMGALLSDSGIGSEAIVHAQPASVVKVEFRELKLAGGSVISLWNVPVEQRTVTVPFPGVELSAFVLMDHLRNSFISKFRNEQWDKSLIHHDAEEIVQVNEAFDYLLAQGQERFFVISLLTKFETFRCARPDQYGPEHGSRHLEYLQQHRVDIDQQKFQEMIDDEQRAGSQTLPRAIMIYCRIIE